MKTRNVKKVKREMARIFGGSCVARAKTDNRKRKDGGTNRLILWKQIEAGRDPTVLDHSEMNDIMDSWKKYVNDRVSFSGGGISTAAMRVAEQIVRAIQTNIDLAYGFAPNKESYEKRKLKKVGHTKPLVYTGKLRNSFKPDAKVK